VPDEVHHALAETGRKFCYCGPLGGTPNSRKKARQRFLTFLYDILFLVDCSLAGVVALSHALAHIPSHNSVPSSLIIQYPFSVACAIQLKTKELRMTKIPPDKIGSRVFLAESGTKTTFDPSASATTTLSSFGRHAQHIIGSAVLVRFETVTEDQLTEQLAAEVCLTVTDLKRAWLSGYDQIWHLGDATRFESPILAAELYSSSRVGTIWTNCVASPRMKLPDANS